MGINSPSNLSAYNTMGLWSRPSGPPPGNRPSGLPPGYNSAPPIPQRDYSTPAQIPVASLPNFSGNVPLNTNSRGTYGDMFSTPISTKQYSNAFQPTDGHPVKLPKFYRQEGPIETNAFYGNLLVEPQTLPVWTHPYSVWNCQDPQFKGLAIAHIAGSQKVFGPEPNSNPARYFFNPVGICSMMLGATEFEQSNSFSVGDCQRFSAGILYQTGDCSGTLRSTLVQGMGFISGIYSGRITPQVSSKVGFQNLQSCGGSNGLNKYLVTLFDNTKWVIYTTVADLRLQDNNHITGQRSSNNEDLLQVAKLTSDDSSTYDLVSGSYATGMHLSSQVNTDSIVYSFNYDLAGSSTSQQCLFWALPHHYQTFTSQMSGCATNLVLDSTVKGQMKGFVTTRFEMSIEVPPQSLQMNPWAQFQHNCNISASALQLIGQVATQEVNSFDVVNVSNTDSMYTAGKILDKGAYILYTLAFILRDQALTTTFLGKMKDAIKRFSDNKQQEPLVYDSNWKGLVSRAGLDGNFYKDFGNTFYNDHHFHYGYHIHSAAIIALVDKEYGDGSWINEIKEWIDNLVRDVSNPSSQDPYFPVFRSYDWFNGHSWANGLFASGDGKDEESTSEDYNYSYALRCWGQVSGNSNLANLGSLMLGVSRVSMGNYFLFKKSNTVQPASFIGNKVTGILFENKVDHVTYFGLNKEYIHGIHMLPITPVSSFIRTPEYVQEEWYDSGLNELVKSVDDGWKGILMLNYALYDPKAAWSFFSDANFQDKWLDNGMSRTWCLTFCAGIGGC